MEEVYGLSKSNEGKKMPDFAADPKLNNARHYKPSPELKDAVNVAILLGKPLLLTGEPGTGKTQLAYSIADQLDLGDPERFNVRTTSVATDLFYRYDAMAHFRYNSRPNNPDLQPKEIEEHYIRYQALGKAILSHKRTIVLIDEIDKAPRDLPNDILNVLEDMKFEVPEIGETKKSESNVRPVIILTSNSEKNLPDAFLRRCVYYHIPFPEADELLGIITARVTTRLFDETTIKENVIPHFMVLRNMLKKKKPSTAELLNWLVILESNDFAPSMFPAYNNGSPHYDKMEEETKKALFKSISVLTKTEEDLKIVKKAFWPDKKETR